MRTAVQIRFNGHDGGVVTDVSSALRRVELNLNDGRELLGFSQDYPMLHAADVRIGLAYRLAKIAAYEGRESIELVTHDLDAAPNAVTDVGSYDLVDPRDPSALVAIALMKAEDTEIDLVEIEEHLAADVQGLIDLLSPGVDNADRLIEGFRALEAVFGVGTDDIARIDWNSIDVKAISTDEDLADAIADAAVAAFDRAATRAFTDEPAPSI